MINKYQIKKKSFEILKFIIITAGLTYGFYDSTINFYLESSRIFRYLLYVFMFTSILSVIMFIISEYIYKLDKYSTDVFSKTADLSWILLYIYGLCISLYLISQRYNLINLSFIPYLHAVYGIAALSFTIAFTNVYILPKFK
jgi:hypothetical protein